PPPPKFTVSANPLSAMTITRRASRSSAAAAAATDSQPETIAHDSTSSEQPTAASEDSTVDSTHQASEHSHVKEDQRLEAAESGLSTEESTTAEQPSEVAETVATESHENEKKESDESALHQEGKEDINSVHLVGHIKGIPGHVQESDTVRKQSTKDHLEAINDDNSLTDDAPVPQTTETVPQVEQLETTKHAKRPVEDDSNTVEEHDYSAGTYKSPFRHSEKVGKEDRL
ncbi:hypothetical protein BGX20_001980, partial [Mortierella sp. AD010]